MIARRQAHDGRVDTLCARARKVGIAQNDELSSAVCLGLAMHAQKARIVVADIAHAGRVAQVLSLGATDLSRRAIVGVVALNENAGARPPLGCIDATYTGAP